MVILMWDLVWVMLLLAAPVRQIMILSLPGGLIAGSVKGDDQRKCAPKGAGVVIFVGSQSKEM